MKKYIIPFALVLFFAACNQFTGNQNNDTPPQDTVVVIDIDTVFASHADSLEYVLNHFNLNPRERLKIYEQLCWYFGEEDLDKAIYYGKLGLDLSDIVKDDTLKSLLHFNMGVAYSDKQNFDSATIHLNEALQYAQKIGKEGIEISIYSEFGRLFGIMGNELTSIEYYEKVIRLSEEKGYYDKMAVALLNIAVKHYNDENDEQAEKYLHRALEIYQTKVENPENYVFSHIYSNFSKVYRATNRYEEALEAAQKTLEYAQLAKSKFYEKEALINLSGVYAQYYEEYDKALALANQALSLAEETGNHFSIKTCLHTIGNTYLLAKNYEKGKIYALRALEFAHPDDLTGMKMTMRLLIHNLILLRETDEALSAFEKFDSLSTALYQEDTQATLSEHEVRYETEKKQLEIERQQEVISRQNLQRGLLAGGIGLSVVILALLWFLLRLRNRRNRELAEMNLTKDKFFNIISHDLKSPAIAQRDALQMLINNIHKWNTDDMMDYCIELLKSAEGEVELLFNLLSWSQLQTGRMAYSPETFLLSDLLPGLSLIQKMAESKDITLNINIPENELITCDVKILNTVIRNLLVNAIKFTEPNGTVTLDISCRDVACHVSITDTGIGMTENQLRNIFRLDASHSQQGTAGEQGSGLGLIVCKDLLEKHGSKLLVESKEGEGSRFWFVIEGSKV